MLSGGVASEAVHHHRKPCAQPQTQADDPQAGDRGHSGTGTHILHIQNVFRSLQEVLQHSQLSRTKDGRVSQLSCTAEFIVCALRQRGLA